METKRKWWKTALFWMLLLGAVFLVMRCLSASDGERRATISYSQFTKSVADGNVESVEMEGYKISGLTKRDERFITYMPAEDEALLPLLREHNVQISVTPVSNNGWLSWLIPLIFPLIILIFLFPMLRGMMSGQGSQAMKFGKSNARLVDDKKSSVTFEDVAGVPEAVESVGDIKRYLKDPKEFSKLGGKVPKGILLTGPPGTGKTLLAKALAGEAGVPFFLISGSDFVEMFVGVGASRVRDLFEDGKKHAPCIIFIDEIDAVGRHRGSGLGGGHDEREQTLNQLLVAMDGVEENSGVIIIAATNRPDILDPALLRPGRFDRTVVLPVPDRLGCEKILRARAKGRTVSASVDFAKLAEEFLSATGAILESITNEAANLATKRGKTEIDMDDYLDAEILARVGAARLSAERSPEMDRVIACHEAGHTVAALLEGKDVKRVTIISHGSNEGFTMFNEDEKMIPTDENALRAIRFSLGGRAAEECFLGIKTAGASGDIAQATELVKNYICVWGFGDLGPIAFGKKHGSIFLGHELSSGDEMSEETKSKIDVESREIVNRELAWVKENLLKNRELVEGMTKELLAKKTLKRVEITEIVKEFGMDKVKTV